MPAITPDRIGIDVGRKLRLEDAVGWAGQHDVGIIDIQLDTGANVVTGFDQARAHAIRRACDHHDIRLGLHTLSAVNVAEYAPLVADAVDAYLRAYIDAAVLLGAEWIVVHAGFHFSADIPLRMQAALDRLRRVADYADHKSILLLLENLNKEPADAEVHSLAHTIEEWQWFYERLESRIITSTENLFDWEGLRWPSSLKPRSRR
jgi:sugar phosphate isomerase/epimerase